MGKNYEILIDTPDAQHDRDALVTDILVGLTAPNKYLSSKYFYDDRGSELFQKITDAPEYYLTNCEAEIFERYGNEILSHANDGFLNFIELGAGDGRKTKILLERLTKNQKNFRYVPIDISREAIRGLCTSVSDNFPEMDVHGLVSEYFDGINWIGRSNRGQNFVLFLGSNLGNFPRGAAHEFLTRLWMSLNHGDLLLIGLDLQKSLDLLLPAYSDKEGYTREFNLNLLDRINDELTANFRRDQFEHLPRYNEELQAMESCIVSKVEQTVVLGELGRQVHFAKNESIHTEFSHKYSPEQIREIATGSGFEVVEMYFDERSYFSDSIWRVVKK